MNRILEHLRRFGSDRSGAAAVEFALWLGASFYPLLNVVDFGLYSYDRLQVENASQMAVQSVSTACGQLAPPPVLTNCRNVSGFTTDSMILARAQSTSLGSLVTVSAEYECQATDSSTLSVTKIPTSAASPVCPGSSGSYSGDYVGVVTTFTYVPLFKAVTITSILGTTISRTYWMRMI
jgi:Flp pilus assembly protein TadG